MTLTRSILSAALARHLIKNSELVTNLSHLF